KRVTVGHQTGEETFEIGAHLRIGILLHKQACGCVAQKQRQQSALHAGARSPVDNGPRDLDETTTARLELKRAKRLPEHDRSITRTSRLRSRVKPPLRCEVCLSLPLSELQYLGDNRGLADDDTPA